MIVDAGIYFIIISLELKFYRFLGNVEVGNSISIEELKRLYDAIILAYGSESEKKLNIIGEDLPQVYSSRDFVGWFNGHPQYKYEYLIKMQFYDKFRDLKFDLSSSSAVIIGHGNVALDVGRMLLRPIEELSQTDITLSAQESLKNSKIKRHDIPILQ
jgi:NADPH-dependent glutamate synthase beta subunit-like oxidoreductase